MSLEEMHKKLRQLIDSKHTQIYYFCPSCESKLEYSYLEEGLYHVRCPECDEIEALVWAKNPYLACLQAGGLEIKPNHFFEEDGKCLCTNCASDLMGWFNDSDIKVIQCPVCGTRISDVVEVEE